ncbi:MAG: glycine/sarcosine/betaine reductase complex component C subunit beta [Bacillota bacterium]|nr:glycine/sarcosine/betaine reductase complex component C subunit beta [Bacillota bacterium]
MSKAVLKSAGYVLVHVPELVKHTGTTQTVERAKNPDSDYLNALDNHLRLFEEVVKYAPNQVYIGNMVPEDLRSIEMPWCNNLTDINDRFGKFGEIMPEDEFIGLIKISDVFDLVKIEKSFASSVKEKLSNHPMISEEEIGAIGDGDEISEIESLVNEGNEPLYFDKRIVGCVKKAHDIDVNLNSHVMLENLVVKASGVLAFKNLIKKNNIDIESIDYVIECSEEACGDMNQRGGGNFAKSLAEAVDAVNATGSDVRAFCAAPIHSLINAASLVASGTYKNVVVVAGGATSKLGMNGKDHVKKDLPILEDTLGGFAVLISENDGFSPVIRNDLVGCHTVGAGSSPQAVITSLIIAPLEKNNLKVTDVDKYSVEMQNPDITKPAGAGDVPESNYKMIGAMGVKRGDIDRKELPAFVKKHGLPGWAPTQGHIPSGVPYLGFAIDDLTKGSCNRTMIVGKGSLFLGRMTNLFDGASIIIERNPGEIEDGNAVNDDSAKKLIAKLMKNLAEELLAE